MKDPRAGQDCDPGSWLERQQGDPELDKVRELINQGLNVSQVRRSEFPQVHGWLQTWDRLELRDGILGRCIQEPDTGQQAFQLIVPTQHARELWEDYHKAAGHANSEKVLSILQRRFYWLGMAKDIKSWTVVCPQCVTGKVGPKVRVPLVRKYLYVFMLANYE